MCNGNWVCFNCRLAVRRPTWRLLTYVSPWLVGRRENDGINCPRCRQACYLLGPTIELPRKDDKKGWAKLRERVTQDRAAWVAKRFEEDVRHQHMMEHRVRDQIVELEKRPPNAGRAKMIRRLKQLVAGA